MLNGRKNRCGHNMQELNDCYVCGGNVHHVTYVDDDNTNYTLLIKCNKCKLETGAFGLQAKDYYEKRNKIEAILADEWNSKSVWIHLRSGGYGSYWLPKYLEQHKKDNESNEKKENGSN